MSTQHATPGSTVGARPGSPMFEDSPEFERRRHPLRLRVQLGER